MHSERRLQHLPADCEHVQREPEKILGLHSSCTSLRGTASQLLDRTGPFASVRSVYMAVTVARLIMKPGLRNFASAAGSAADNDDVVSEAAFDLAPRTAFFGFGSSAYLKYRSV